MGSELAIRRAEADDSMVCGRICYQAFSRLNAAHNFPCDFPGPETTIGLLSRMFSSPGLYCIVAEAEGRIVGSNAVDERSIIAGVGPITVDPDAQNLGVGRALMRAAIDRENERGAAGIRLVQAAFHNRSLSLYTSLGFDVREPLSCLQGRTAQRSVEGCTVQAAEAVDLDACNALSRRVHGFDRGADLAQSIEQGTALIVKREGRITGYASAWRFAFAHVLLVRARPLFMLLARKAVLVHLFRRRPSHSHILLKSPLSCSLASARCVIVRKSSR